jgi:subtilase family serine protease
MQEQSTMKSPECYRRNCHPRTCRFEHLESRELLSVAGAMETRLTGITALPMAISTLAAPGQGPTTPAQISRAYGLDRLARFSGNTPADGTGQTIAIIGAFDDPTIESDLKVFDTAFKLRDPPSFKKVDQRGGTKYPPPDASWAMEIALDVEWAHAIAPGAGILLVETDSDYLDDLLTGVDYARRQPGVTVVSMSWGTGEFASERLLDSYFTTPPGHEGVTFVASTGDQGVPPCWPALSPNVLAVGGTSLKMLDASGAYRGETGWCHGGGGVSMYEPEPDYQRGVQNTGSRTAPDVAYNADPRAGFAVYNSTGPSDSTGWITVGGTSAGAPQWAGMMAIVNQGRAAAGPLRAAPAAVYQLRSTDFHDVASGANGFSAVPGYDLVTGRGTPYADRVIEDLARWNGKPASVASGLARPDALRAAARIMAISTVLAMPNGCATAASAVLTSSDGVTEGAPHRAKARFVPLMQGIAGSQWSLYP